MRVKLLKLAIKAMPAVVFAVRVVFAEATNDIERAAQRWLKSTAERFLRRQGAA